MEQSRKIHPHMFNLLLAMASMTMVFIALTSAYLVRRAAGNWLEFKLPDWFLWSTVTIIITSITLEGAKRFYKKQQEGGYKGMLVLSTLLGLGFIALQYAGWQEMYSWGIELTGNPSGSFVYVISGLHAAHVIGGLTALGIALVHAFSLPFELRKFRLRSLSITTAYWHFLGWFWNYLLVFLILHR